MFGRFQAPIGDHARGRRRSGQFARAASRFAPCAELLRFPFSFRHDFYRRQSDDPAKVYTFKSGTCSLFDLSARATITGNGGSIRYLILPTKAVLILSTSPAPAIQVVEQSSDRRIPDPTRECGRRVGAIGPAFFFAGLRIENKYWVGKTNDGDGLCASRGGRGHEGFGKLQYLGIHANFVVGA
jgi:hypothetical protein